MEFSDYTCRQDFIFIGEVLFSLEVKEKVAIPKKDGHRHLITGFTRILVLVKTFLPFVQMVHVCPVKVPDGLYKV